MWQQVGQEVSPSPAGNVIVFFLLHIRLLAHDNHEGRQKEDEMVDGEE